MARTEARATRKRRAVAIAQPAWTSLDPLAIHGDVLDVGRGNWQSGQDSGSAPTKPKWMAVVSIDGQVQRGTTPGMPSVPASTLYPGELDWGARLAFPLGTWKDGKEHTAQVRVYAASYYAPDDRYEWGHFSSRDNSPAVLGAKFTLGAAPAPAPTPAGLDAVITALDKAKAHWLASQARARVVKANGANYPKTAVGRMESELEVALWHAHELRRQG